VALSSPEFGDFCDVAAEILGIALPPTSEHFDLDRSTAWK
jgi:hypothetical protein